VSGGIGEAPENGVQYARKDAAWEPVSAVHVSDDEPATPVTGQLWYKPTDDEMYVYDGSDWKSFGSGGDGAPGDPYWGSVSLLLNGDDEPGGSQNIVDATGKNAITVVNNAQIDTAAKKYGTGSIKFGGAGDHLKGIPAADQLNMGAGDWTIEGWYYAKTLTARYPLFIGNNAPTYPSGGLAITLSNDDLNGINNYKLTLANYNDSAQRLLVASSVHNLNQWYHFALVRNGTNITMYRDGTSVASKTISSSLTYDWGLNGVLVGGGNWDGAGSYSDAYYDDLRITKGVARYTDDFTPPDKLPTKQGARVITVDVPEFVETQEYSNDADIS